MINKDRLKRGDRVINIKNSDIAGWDFTSLTKGCEYIVKDFNSFYVLVYDDSGGYSSYPYEYFIDVTTNRNIIIDEVLK